MRRSRQLLPRVRMMYRQLRDDLPPGAAGGPFPALLRTFAVQQVSYELSTARRSYHATRIATALLVLAVPPVVLAESARGAAAWVSYGWFVGVLLLVYGVQQQRVGPRQLTAGLAAAAALALLAATRHEAAFWRDVGAAALAATLLATLIVARLAGLLWLHRTVIGPLAVRRAGWLLPSQLAAVRLLPLAGALDEARRTNRHPRWRVNFLRWMQQVTELVRWELPHAAYDLRLDPAVQADAAGHADRLAAQLRGLQLRLLYDQTDTGYDEVRGALDTLIGGLVRGDWSVVTAEPEPPATGTARRLAGRLGPSVLLVAAAALLPHVPGIAAPAGTVAGVQLGLVLTAVVGLVPGRGGRHEEVLGLVPRP